MKRKHNWQKESLAQFIKEGKNENKDRKRAENEGKTDRRQV